MHLPSVPTTTRSGFTYVELIVVASIMVLIFGAILISFQYALQLGYNTRVKLSALSLANDRLEFFRSLPYNDVGVVSGFPAGTIPQTSTFELNGFTIDETVSVVYIDGVGDGEAGADGNGIITDYKQINVEYEWVLDGTTDSLSLNSLIVPRSIESNVGGGTIRVNVFDAGIASLVGATVRVLSSSSTFSYDVTNTTGSTGSALFSVPADSGYQVFVGGPIGGNQYSTSSTYVATTSNPIPAVAPIAVTEAGISTISFQIAEVSDLEVNTLSSITEDTYLEAFLNSDGVATSSDTNITAGELVLADSGGVYETSGTIYLDTIAPTTLESWEAMRVVADVPPGTNYVVQFFTGTTSAYSLIPNADLSENSSGFTDTIIDLSELDATLYPTTTVGITLTTSDTSLTPAIRELEVFWREGTTVRTNETLTLQGSKSIGTDASSTPIYKYEETIITDGTGDVTVENLEFDTYVIESATAYTLASACPAYPHVQIAGEDSTLDLVYVSPVSTSLRVHVVDALGRSVPGANLRLERGAYDVTQESNSCGQTFFSGGLTDETDYELTVSSPGYTTEIVDPLEITGNTTLSVTLLP